MTFRGWIEFGSQPTPAQLADQTSFDPYQSSPVDGSVIKLLNDSGLDITSYVWNSTKWSMSQLTESLFNIRKRNNLGWGRHRYNFVKLQITNRASLDLFTPGMADGFISNFKTIMDFVSEAGLTGIFFDVEPYSENWKYSGMSYKNVYTFEQYKQNMYAISREIFSHWKQINPKVQIMVSDCYEVYASGKEAGTADINNRYGLYVPFLDGIIDEVHELRTQTTVPDDYYNFILTNQLTYKEKSSTNINRYGYCQINGTFDPVIPPPDPNYLGNSAYFTDPDTISERGLCLWIDAAPFNPATPASNYFTPAVFKQQLGRVMDLCQWCYILDLDYEIRAGEVGSEYITAMLELRAERGMF